MTPEPLTGPALRSAIRAILARPVAELPRPEQTEARETTTAAVRTQSQITAAYRASRARDAIAARVARVKPKRAVKPRKAASNVVKPRKPRPSRGTGVGRSQPKVNYAECVEMAKAGAKTADLAARYDVTQSAVNKLLRRLWPEREVAVTGAKARAEAITDEAIRQAVAGAPSVYSAAKKLGVHRNTVMDRLKRMKNDKGAVE